MGLQPILPVKLPVASGTMINFDGDCDGDGHGIGTCKHSFSPFLPTAEEGCAPPLPRTRYTASGTPLAATQEDDLVSFALVLYLNLACLAASAAAASLLLGEHALQHLAEGAAHHHYVNSVQCLQKQVTLSLTLKHTNRMLNFFFIIF